MTGKSEKKEIKNNNECHSPLLTEQKTKKTETQILNNSKKNKNNSHYDYDVRDFCVIS